MGIQAAGSNVIPFPDRAESSSEAEVGDLRFLALLGAEAWNELPEAVRTRFAKRVAGARLVVYAGEVIECKMSRCGWLLAQLARAIGGPLPISRAIDVPASVAVSEDPRGGGQFWTRVYGRRRGFPQVIHSAKRFAGPTGLEEHVGRGFGIALTLTVENQALHFLSNHYFFEAFGIRLRLPRWLEPGRLRVSHVDCNHGWFAFVLRLDHSLLGELVAQTAMFREFHPHDSE
jgi:hypothetical protein